MRSLIIRLLIQVNQDVTFKYSTTAGTATNNTDPAAVVGNNDFTCAGLT